MMLRSEGGFEWLIGRGGSGEPQDVTGRVSTRDGLSQDVLRASVQDLRKGRSFASRTATTLTKPNATEYEQQVGAMWRTARLLAPGGTALSGAELLARSNPPPMFEDLLHVYES